MSCHQVRLYTHVLLPVASSQDLNEAGLPSLGYSEQRGHWMDTVLECLLCAWIAQLVLY